MTFVARLSVVVVVVVVVFSSLCREVWLYSSAIHISTFLLMLLSI